MKEYLYHGQAFGVDADITDPGPHRLDGHGRCALPDGKAGKYEGRHDGYQMPGGLSHGLSTTSVHAMDEDREGYFRTEIRSTVENLVVDGKRHLSVDRIEMGMISVYRRSWFDRAGFHGRRTRVLPLECRIVNARLDGQPLELSLPAPFHYSADRRETYLAGDEPDPAVDAEIRQAILDSASRVTYIPNFGRIFFGEWTLVPAPNLQPVHQISMLRMAFSSPPSGTGTGGNGQGGGSGGF